MRSMVLVRHGETAWNREARWQGRRDLPLTAAGEAQARAVAERLVSLRAASLHVSDLARAWQTGHMIGRLCGLEPIAEPDLREVDVGSWEGLTATEAAQRHPEGHARWLAGETGWDDGETYPAMAERARGFARRLAAELRDGQCAILVSHGGPIRAIVAACLGVPGEGRRTLGQIANGSISAVELRAGSWALSGYNDIGHLQGLAGTSSVATAEQATLH